METLHNGWGKQSVCSALSCMQISECRSSGHFIQRNAFFAHPENILLGMLSDDDENVQRLAVNKILSVE